MIDERILNEFREHITDPKYIVVITDIKNGEPVCNEESLIISAEQIFLPLEDYLDDSTDKSYKAVKKKLTVYSNIGINENNLYVGELNGYISEEEVKNVVKTSETESSHWIEIVDTTLQDTIDITFNNEVKDYEGYKNIPKIIVTIDEKDKKLYSNYSTEFVKNDKCYYTGVKITFNNLKNKNSRPKIGITIIGDEKTSKYDDEGNLLPEYRNIKLNLFYKIINNESNEEEHVPIIEHKILIDDIEYLTNKCGSIDENLIKGEHCIKIPSYTNENNIIYYPEIEEFTKNLEDNTIIPIEFNLKTEEDTEGDNDSG